MKENNLHLDRKVYKRSVLQNGGKGLYIPLLSSYCCVTLDKSFHLFETCFSCLEAASSGGSQPVSEGGLQRKPARNGKCRADRPAAGCEASHKFLF